MDWNSSERTSEYTDQDDCCTMDDYMSNQPAGGEALGSFQYPLPDQWIPQQHLGSDHDPRNTTFPAMEHDSKYAVDDTSMHSVSEGMSGNEDIPVSSNFYDLDEVYNPPYVIPDQNSILSDEYSYSGSLMEHRPMIGGPRYPARANLDQGTTSPLDMPSDRIVPTFAGTEPWVPQVLEGQGSTGAPKFCERPYAAQYYGQDSLAIGHTQGRDNSMETGTSTSISRVPMVGTEDIILPDGPQYHLEAHQQEYIAYPSQQGPHAHSLDSQQDDAGYYPNPNHSMCLQECPSGGSSPISYRRQPAAPIGLVGLSDHSTSRDVDNSMRTLPSSVQPALVYDSGPSSTLSRQHGIGNSPELFTNFGQQASGYVGSWPEQIRMTDPPAMAAQSAGFDFRVQTATPVPQRELEDRSRKESSRRRHSDTPQKRILPRKERSGPTSAFSGRLSKDTGPFQILDSEMKPTNHRRTRNLSPGGREHAKKMRKKGVCGECKRKKSKVRG